MVMLVVTGMRGKVRWVENLKQSMEEIEWMGTRVEELGRLSNGEVVQMLSNCISGGQWSRVGRLKLSNIQS